MENASKALTMAASILVGVLIISFAVFLYSTYVGFASDNAKKNEKNFINEFNTQYTKYYGTTLKTIINSKGKEEEILEPILCTIHDVITLSNLARENNIQYEMNGNDYLKYSGKENTFYIQIDLKLGNETKQNIERKSLKEKTDIIKKYSLNSNNKVVNFVCTECKISKITKRVYYMKFEMY